MEALSSFSGGGKVREEKEKTYFSEFQTRFDKGYLPLTYYDLQTMTKGVSLLTQFFA